MLIRSSTQNTRPPIGCFAPDSLFINLNQAASFDQMATRYPDVAYMLAASGVNQMRSGMIAGSHLQTVKVYGTKICKFSRFNGSYIVFKPQSFRGIQCAHAQGGVRRNGFSIVALRLCQQCGGPHFAKQVEPVVARRPVRPDADVDSSPYHRIYRRDTAGKLKVGGGAMGYGTTQLCQQR